MIIYISILLLIAIIFLIFNKDLFNKKSNINKSSCIEDIFDNFKNKNRTLSNIKNINKYIDITIPLNIRLELKFIIQKIIKNINKNFNYNLFLIQIEDVEVSQDNNGNKHYNIIILINNNNDFTGARLILNFIIYINRKFKTNNVDICTDMTNPPFRKYYIGIPSNDQLIPLPSEVITTQRGIISNNSIDKIEYDSINYIYINNIKLLNSNLVINGNDLNDKEDNKMIDKSISGLIKTKNEFSILKNCNNNPFIEPSIIRNKWPRLNNQPTDIEQWPCQPAPKTWNELGVSFYKMKYTKECPGKRESTEQTDLQGQYYPSIGPLPRNKGNNVWLFDRARGIPSFPTGTS